MAKNPTCQVCNANPQAIVGGAPLVTRAGSRACLACAKKTQCAPVSLKLHLPTNEPNIADDRKQCVVIVTGQCPWCPQGQAHCHVLQQASITNERIAKAVERIGDAQASIDVPSVWHMNLNA